MNRTLIALAAGILAVGGGAQAATANACFWARDITNWRAVGDRQVNLEVNNRDVYRLDLAGTCSELHFAGQSLILDARGTGGPVCAGSLADIIVPRQGNFRCPVQTITRLSRAEVKALPKKERP